MKSSLNLMPGYRMNEYQLILSPHEELRHKISSVKKEFYEKFKIDGHVGSRPHLGLVSFAQFEMNEDRIINRLRTIAMGYNPFKVELKNFGSYPSHTIFINVESKLQVQNLIKELKTAQQILTLNKDNKAHFFDNPHIMIAGKLLPWQYEQAWLEYNHMHFAGRFIASEMLLLKRRQGDKPYLIAERFDFMNLPVSIKQGDLFI